MGSETISSWPSRTVFHGEPHSANLVLITQGELALFDFGMVGFLSRGDIDTLNRLFVALINYDAEAVLRASTTTRSVDANTSCVSKTAVFGTR
jgi:ubiquinone biosynthesis protein